MQNMRDLPHQKNNKLFTLPLDGVSKGVACPLYIAQTRKLELVGNLTMLIQIHLCCITGISSKKHGPFYMKQLRKWNGTGNVSSALRCWRREVFFIHLTEALNS